MVKSSLDIFNIFQFGAQLKIELKMKYFPKKTNAIAHLIMCLYTLGASVRVYCILKSRIELLISCHFATQ